MSLDAHLRLHGLKPVFSSAISAVRLVIGAVRALQGLRGAAQTICFASFCRSCRPMKTQHVICIMACPP